MKLKLLPLLFCITAFSVTAKPVIIKGKINGKLPEILRYTAPVNGSQGFSFNNTTTPDTEGNFTIKIDVEALAIIDLFSNYTPSGSIIVTPGSIYNVIINPDDKENQLTVQGTTSEYQKLYNNICKDHGQSLIFNLAKEFRKSTATDIKQKLQEREIADVAAFQNLLKVKAIPQDIFNYIKTERSYFYACVIGYAAFNRFIDSLYEANNEDLSGFNELWGDVYMQHPVNGKDINKTPWGYFFLHGYVYYNVFGKGGIDRKKFEATDALQIIAAAEKVVPAQYLEYYIAGHLHDSAIEGSTAINLVTILDNFNKKYPISGYNTLLEKEIAPIRKLHNTSTNISGNTVFVDNYTNINSVDELIKKFPGKKLYIDVWATWCGPCREEFKYKEELYKLLKTNDITVVYISIDTDEKDEAWKKMINYYGLESYHIRTNKTFSNQLYYFFNVSGTIAIPWYMLVGADGVIASKYAPPPSEMDKLEKEISKL